MTNCVHSSWSGKNFRWKEVTNISSEETRNASIAQVIKGELVPPGANFDTCGRDQSLVTPSTIQCGTEFAHVHPFVILASLIPLQFLHCLHHCQYLDLKLLVAKIGHTWITLEACVCCGSQTMTWEIQVKLISLLGDLGKSLSSSIR